MLEVLTISLAIGISQTPSPDQNRALNQLALSYVKHTGMDIEIKKYQKKIENNLSKNQVFFLSNAFLIGNAIDKQYVVYRWEF